MAMQFRALTYNVFKFGGRVNPEAVVDQVLPLDFDVIGIQEVFNSRLSAFGIRAHNARKILGRRQGEAGYETRWRATGGPGPFRILTGMRFQDGLMIGVRRDKWRFDPAQDYFDELLRRRGFDRRGIQCVLLREKEGAGRTVAFCNTHLSVGMNDRQRQRRVDQIAKALDFIGRIENENQPVATIFVGDFNALDNAGELAPIRLGTPQSPRFADTFRDLNPGDEGFTVAVENTIVQDRDKPPEGSARIDYVYLRPAPGVGGVETVVTPVSSRVVLTQRVDGKNLSDHYGILAEFAVA